MKSETLLYPLTISKVGVCIVCVSGIYKANSTVISMGREIFVHDEARHGKAFEGLLARYFG